MGTYVYKSKPSHIARAIVRDGEVISEVEIALYSYAYKPYMSWGSDNEARNRRMHFRSGAQACENAWKRTAREMPRLGVHINGDDLTVYLDTRRPFLTGGDPISYDDYEKYPADAEIVRWVSLPDGVSMQRKVI